MAPSASSTLSPSAIRNSSNNRNFQEDLPLAHAGDRNRPAGLLSATETPRPSRRRRSLPPGSTLVTHATAVTTSAAAAAAAAAAAETTDEPATGTEESWPDVSPAVATAGPVTVKGLQADGARERGKKDGSEWTTTPRTFTKVTPPRRGSGGVNPRVGATGLGPRLLPSSPPEPPPLPQSSVLSGTAPARVEAAQQSRTGGGGCGGGAGGSDGLDFESNDGDGDGGRWQGDRPSETSRRRRCSTTTRAKQESGSANAEAPLQSTSSSPLALGNGPRRGSSGSAGQARLDPAVWRDNQAATDAESSIGVCSGGGSITRRIDYRSGDAGLDGGWDGVGDAVGLEMSIVGGRSLGMRSRTPGRARRAPKR